MADTTKKDTKDTPAPAERTTETEGRPESPTTAQPLDFDDDLDAQTPTKPTQPDSAPKPPPKDEAPPAKPPRPVSAREQAENTLQEAFPSIELSVIKAVLAASGGQVEPAFNALLGMTDPESQKEPEPPARPPRPARNTAPQQQTQLEADELYARQLQEHYANSERARNQAETGYGYNENLQGSRTGRPGGQGGNPNNNPEDRSEWRSFLDDDLPEIRDNIKKGFLETQTTVNRWITSFKKTIDGEADDGYDTQQQSRPAQNFGSQQQGYNRRSSEMRRSQDLARYDADPQVIGDDFSKLELRDGEHPPRTSSRPPANPNLFKGDGNINRTKSPGSGRKVSFQDGPPEEITDLYSASSKPSTTTTTASTDTPASGSKTSKWQPLSKVEPSPVAENDPFSLGDSEDEKDAKPISLTDNDKDDTQERLRKAMNEATEDSIGGGDTKKETAKVDSTKK